MGNDIKIDAEKAKTINHRVEFLSSSSSLFCLKSKIWRNNNIERGETRETAISADSNF